MKVGVFPGKFSPPHRGHLAAIIEASCQCDKLYVVVSQHDVLETKLYEGIESRRITLKQKLRWLSIELAEFEHIKVIGLDESAIPLYPEGWPHWAALLNKTVPEPFQLIFGGEPEYADNGYSKYYPDVDYRIFEKTAYPISATEIRAFPYKHWEYILGAAREHYVKRVLITGTESCGKTTMAKMLAKIFFTSWSREEGRFYSTKYMGGNERVFELDDFYKIAWEQRQLDDHAVRTANKIVFFDTDAVVTQYYCKMYLGAANEDIETLVKPANYDLVLMLQPDVPWIADGFRYKGDSKERWRLHDMLLTMYQKRGFNNNFIQIGGSHYSLRLAQAIDLSTDLIK